MKKIFILIAVAVLSACGRVQMPANCKLIDAQPCIFPDYNEVTIPCNIAPLNFMLADTVLPIVVEAKNDNGFSYVMKNSCGKVVWPAKVWEKLKNGKSISITIAVQNSDGGYSQYQPIIQHVVADSVDSYLAYRLINTGYVLWEKMGLYQRCLENFEQSPIIESQSVDRACMNCHTFCNNNPNTMMFHTRMHNGGTNIIYNGKVKRYNTKTPISMSAGVYASWNPNGYLLAMSTNAISQQFTSGGDDRIFVSDRASDIVLLNMKTNTLTTCPQLSTPDLENLPAWAPDGKTLYYITRKKRDSYPMQNPQADDLYDLCRITYNVENNTWGSVDTVLRSSQVGASISFPKVCPTDGRYVAITLADRGYFAIQNKQSDIALLNVETGELTKPQINSNFAESNHAWSSNGHWLVVGSKRIDGTFTRPFIAYFDANGDFSKPFVVPQKEPDFYKNFLLNFNNSDFMICPVPKTQIELRNAVRGKIIQVEADSSVDIDALSGATNVQK